MFNLFDSHQLLQHKLGVIRTLKHRANTISSNQDFLDQELSHIQQALSVCGYTKWVWQSSASNKVTPRPRSHNTPPVGSTSLPYIQGATEALSCIIRKAGVQASLVQTAHLIMLARQKGPLNTGFLNTRKTLPPLELT